MSEARAVTAGFTPLFELSVSRIGNGSGTVASTPTGINCGATCESAFPDNTLVTLTATPGEGSVFAGWSGACAGTGNCQVTMSEARAVTAGFTPEFELAVSRTGNGTGTIASTPAGIDCGVDWQ